MNQKDIDDLERDLKNFVNNWQISQKQRINSWRKWFFSVFIVILCLIFFLPEWIVLLWWLSVVFIGFSAGSLYKLINEEARTVYRIQEHKKQLKLARALLKFDTD